MVCSRSMALEYAQLLSNNLFHINESLLNALYDAGDRYTKACISRRTIFYHSILEKCISDNLYFIPYDILRNKNIDLSTIKILIKSNDKYLCTQLLKHLVKLNPNQFAKIDISDKCLEVLVDRDNGISNKKRKSICMAIATRGNLPKFVIKELLSMDDCVVKRLAQNKTINKKLVEHLFEYHSTEVKRVLAQRKDLSERLLLLLAKDDDFLVRDDVFSRKNLPPSVISIKDREYG